MECVGDRKNLRPIITFTFLKSIGFWGFPCRHIDTDSMTIRWRLVWDFHQPVPPITLVHAHIHSLSRDDFPVGFRSQVFFLSTDNNKRELSPSIWWVSIVSQAFPPSTHMASGVNAREDLINCNMSFHDTLLLPHKPALRLKRIWWVLWWCRWTENAGQ